MPIDFVRGKVVLVVLAALALATSLGQESKRSGDSLEELAAYLPVGKPVRNLRAPSYQDGKLATMLICAELTKLDERNLCLKDVEARVYQDEKVNRTIKTSRAFYHMPKGYLCGDQQTTLTGQGGLELSAFGFVMDTKRQLVTLLEETHLSLPRGFAQDQPDPP